MVTDSTREGALCGFLKPESIWRLPERESRLRPFKQQAVSCLGTSLGLRGGAGVVGTRPAHPQAGPLLTPRVDWVPLSRDYPHRTPEGSTAWGCPSLGTVASVMALQLLLPALGAPCYSPGSLG